MAITAAERNRAAQIVHDIESNVGRTYTLTVPSSVHYSGNRTGRVVGVAYPSGQGGGVETAQIVLDAECQMVLIPVDAVLGWDLQPA